MPEPQSQPDELRERVAALPHIEDGELLDGPEAHRLYGLLAEIDPVIFKHIGRIVGNVVEEVRVQLEQDPGSSYYAISPDGLRGLVALAVIRGAAQTASDIGRTNKEINSLKEMFPEITTPSSSTLDHPDDPSEHAA